MIGEERRRPKTVILRGGRGSGKTEAMFNLLHEYATVNSNRQMAVLCASGHSVKECARRYSEGSHNRRGFNMFLHHDAPTARYPNGSEVIFTASRERLRGINLNKLYVNHGSLTDRYRDIAYFGDVIIETSEFEFGDIEFATPETIRTLFGDELNPQFSDETIRELQARWGASDEKMKIKGTS